ncbi:hypothetical protein ACGFX2_32975 [Streptomyces goshikiensis]|uniref:hypothetical protein n=1 Tax=Streptomyces goshikiensis TaxID=1942 RepID=UPI003722AB5A
MAFTDQMRACGYAVESILTALKPAGLKIAARTLRAWCAPAGPSNVAAARTVTDALVEDAIRRLAFTTNTAGDRMLAPEGLYGRRKMLALIRRTLLPEAGFGAVDRAMRSLGLNGVVRGRRPRTTTPNPADARAPDLLDRDFTAPAPNRKWITDFTYVRTYESFTYVAFTMAPPRRSRLDRLPGSPHVAIPQLTTGSPVAATWTPRRRGQDDRWSS